MTRDEARKALACQPGHIGAQVRALVKQGRGLEAQRILTRSMGDGRRATETVAALVRAMVTGQ